MIELEYINNLEEFLLQKRDILKSFIGRRLTESWVIWDCEDNEWFTDGPIVLNFENKHLTFCANKFEELAVDENSFDFNKKPTVGWADFDLEWRKNCLSVLNSQLGEKLIKIYATEFAFRGTVLENKQNPKIVGEEIIDWYLSGLDFEFPTNSVSLYNALDQNGVSMYQGLSEDCVFRRR